MGGRSLAEGGVRPGDRVAVYAHRSAPLVWSVLGVLEAGAAFVLLDPAYPPARLVEMLRQAAPRALIELAPVEPVAVEVERAVAEMGAFRLDIPRDVPAVAELGATLEPRPTVGPDDAACLTFTSGSTGQPKAIVGRHGPLSHFLPWQSERFGLLETDRESAAVGPVARPAAARDLHEPVPRRDALYCGP